MTKKMMIVINILFLILSLTSCKKDDSPVNPDSSGTVNGSVFHPKGTELKSLNVISISNLPSHQVKVLMSTLQGLIAKTSSEQIYIDEGCPSSAWKNFLSVKYSIPLNNSFTDWTQLLGHFKDKVSGYILYDYTNNPRSVTAATSLCGPMNAIAVDIGLESMIKSLGITEVIADVRTQNEKWVYENYKDMFNKQMAAELDPEIHYQLRDYITLTNAFTFYDGITSFRSTVMKELNSEAFCFGYYVHDEFNMVANAAAQGVVMIPADGAFNLSAFSSIHSHDGLKQNTYTTPVTEDNVHYVTFVISDGDNVAYNLWSMKGYFDNTDRGKFNMGYQISPSLVDLAPSVMRWYYENAKNGENKDFFIAGPSGSGYTFPSKMPSAEFDTYLNRLNTFMEKANLNIVSILDDGPSTYNRQDLWNKYLAQPNIDAVFYFPYGGSTNGEIRFSSNGKPAIAQRDILWEGLEEESTLISRINSRSANPKSADGYTLVLVHVWTKSLSDIKTVVDKLNPNVRVVTPDVFVKVIKTNLYK